MVATGFGCVERRGRTFAACFAATARPPASRPVGERLAYLRRETLAALEVVKPRVVAVEELFAHGRHPATAIQMAQARGVILEACAAAGVAVHEFAARRVKQAVAGRGNASKEQLGQMVARHLNLPQPPATEHEADALALALCAHFTLGTHGDPDER